MGAWLAVNGESVYGTRAGTIAPTADTVSTRKGDVHYVHALNYVSDCLKLKGLGGSYTATIVGNGATVKCERKGEELVITIPPEARYPYDTVVRLSPA